MLCVWVSPYRGYHALRYVRGIPDRPRRVPPLASRATSDKAMAPHARGGDTGGAGDTAGGVVGGANPRTGGAGPATSYRDAISVRPSTGRPGGRPFEATERPGSSTAVTLSPYTRPGHREDACMHRCLAAAVARDSRGGHAWS